MWSNGDLLHLNLNQTHMKAVAEPEGLTVHSAKEALRSLC